MIIKITKRILILFLITLSLTSFTQDRPRLVIGIIIDQMRQEYVLRFSEKLSKGGFNKLIQDGYQFKNAHYNYVPTYTAPGHASIYTGTTPSNHGIIGNSWFSREKGTKIYCVSDKNVSGVGGTDKNGKMSPNNLLASTITDELLLTSNFKSKVVSVSIKDRGSILSAGHNPTGAYWFDKATGNFMTSTYYTDVLPKWVNSFNKKKLAFKYLDKTWDTLLPIDQYTESTMDSTPYEYPFKDKKNSVFPYNLKELVKSNGLRLINSTPWGNKIVLDFAIAAIEGEELGMGNATDFLAISFSSTDYIGHLFGPNSVELEDTYLRLDQEIERLIDILNRKFNNGYMIFLTSDHGVSEVPLFLKDMKMPGGYSNNEEMTDRVKIFMNKQYGEENWILDISNNQIFLNQPLIMGKKMDLTKICENLRSFLLTFDSIVDVYTSDDLTKRNGTSILKTRIEHGFNTKMSGDIIIRHKSGYIDGGYDKRGTTHGSGYTYDTHVPIIFYGWGIRQGESVRSVSITDIAPTLSMLLNTSLPTISTGRPLKELFK